MDLIAPTYAAASQFHAPVGAPYEYGIDTVPLSELFTDPAARAVLQKEAPFLLGLEKVDAIARNASNFTIPEFSVFFPLGTPETFARIDAGLRSIPASERPRDGR